MTMPRHPESIRGHESAQLCGCDPGCGWVCSRYPHCDQGRMEMQRVREEEEHELARMSDEGCPHD